ncbi:antirestriction protein ArdC [Azospirillum picis]|uniref:Antirestriction protein ArdC n=1 Tax=Azospirillum picis TaxID=488438 RepID=A0ABU0MM14_9PROT|nr:antirestriction protein ArdC [Azospirillum picis]MDQ0534517.1 antirestriction protein ArdC [Azospirillum picis]
MPPSLIITPEFNNRLLELVGGPDGYPDRCPDGENGLDDFRIHPFYQSILAHTRHCFKIRGESALRLTTLRLPHKQRAAGKTEFERVTEWHMTVGHELGHWAGNRYKIRAGYARDLIPFISGAPIGWSYNGLAGASLGTLISGAVIIGINLRHKYQKPYCREEMRAEMTAVLLACHVGFLHDWPDYSCRYLARFLRRMKIGEKEMRSEIEHAFSDATARFDRLRALSGDGLAVRSA